ncbi:MAG: hypothetical protein FJ220_01655 [Kiritimatiellaceae bacterium]|nr:hypothetical protein [Kiritimatiellaceae bacterium]
MTVAKRNWTWFVALMGVIVISGVLIGRSQRPALGKSFAYSMEDYRNVDPSLIHYVEAESLIPTPEKLSALTIGIDGTIYIGGLNAIETFPERDKIALDGLPTCLAIDDDGVLFVGFQDRFTVLSQDRKPVFTKSPGTNTYITSIAVDDTWIYVADAGNRCVLRYSKTGADELEIGAKDEKTGARGFYVPSPFFDLDIGTDGSLWVVNPGYHAFENYTSDGRLISSWEKSGFHIEGFCGCCNPSHFALMPDGSFVTAEKGLPRIKIHNLDGSLRCVVAAPAQFDDGTTGLDVAVDSQGVIYVLDPVRRKVRLFKGKL